MPASNVALVVADENRRNSRRCMAHSSLSRESVGASYPSSPTLSRIDTNLLVRVFARFERKQFGQTRVPVPHMGQYTRLRTPTLAGAGCHLTPARQVTPCPCQG